MPLPSAYRLGDSVGHSGHGVHPESEPRPSVVLDRWREYGSPPPVLDLDLDLDLDLIARADDVAVVGWEEEEEEGAEALFIVGQCYMYERYR